MLISPMAEKTAGDATDRVFQIRSPLALGEGQGVEQLVHDVRADGVVGEDEAADGDEEDGERKMETRT